jgi:hypothetical protein
MLGSIRFKRFDRNSEQSGFQYKKEENSKAVEENPQLISMENLGFNQHVTVQNYMGETVMLGSNIREPSSKIRSLLRDNVRPRADQRNYVVIKIYQSENLLAQGQRQRSTQVTKSEIRIPGQMLNQGSVYIDELDCYLTTETNLAATRELMAHDLEDQYGESEATIPAALVTPDPVVLYHDYRSLIDSCIRRQDKINIRTGFDVRYGDVPLIVQDMHIAILDHYFVPFSYDKLVFDPTLSPDEFIIENIYIASKGEFRYTFSELAKVGAVYLEHDQRRTLFGDFYGMAVFASHQRYVDYVHQRKSMERFRDESLYLAEKSGDPMLKEEIVAQRRDISSLAATLTERDAEISQLRSEKKKLQADLAERERAIKDIRDRKDEQLTAEAVLRGLSNDSAKIENDAKKIENDRVEQDQRAANARMAQRAAILKSISDIMKSGWGIATACGGGLLAFIAVMRKYKVRIAMG